jgi:hypothetical protein
MSLTFKDVYQSKKPCESKMEALQPIFTFRLKEGAISRYSCNLCPKDTRIALIRNDALEKHLQSKHSKDDCDQYDEILKKNKTILPSPASKPRTLFDDIDICDLARQKKEAFELSNKVLA